MENVEQIIDRFKKEIFHDLIIQGGQNNPRVNKGLSTAKLWLAPIDSQEEASLKKEILNDLKENNTIVDYKIGTKTIVLEPIEFSPIQKELYSEEISEYQDNISFQEDEFLVAEIKYYPKQLQAKLRKYSPIPTLIIRDIDLGENCLIINKKRVIDFKSRHGDAENRTKMFKILATLFRYSKEVKHNRPIRKSKLQNDIKKIVSIEILKDSAGATTKAAVLQSIKRLNARFKAERVPIEIRTSKYTATMRIRLRA
ncbi:MAG: hypothetical protein Q8R26_00260 [bacterium]|nr:hypothetical protein [bacterium]